MIIYLVLCWGVIKGMGMKCPSWNCTDHGDKDVCMKIISIENKTTYEVKPCPESSICNVYDYSGSTVYCVKDIKIKNLYPGEYCKHSDQCLRGDCDAGKKICLLKNTDKTCESDIDCDPGSYCDKGKCESLVAIGDKCNDNVDQPKKCVIDAVCNNEKCTKIGSLDVKNPASNSAACKTFYIKEGKCENGPTLKENEPNLACPKGGNCKYSGGETRPCQCGFSEGKNEFCSLGEGDILMNDVNLLLLLIVYKVCW